MIDSQIINNTGSTITILHNRQSLVLSSGKGKTIKTDDRIIYLQINDFWKGYIPIGGMVIVTKDRDVLYGSIKQKLPNEIECSEDKPFSYVFLILMALMILFLLYIYIKHFKK
jgi:hypothetical protein